MSVLFLVLGWRFESALLGYMGSNKNIRRLNTMSLLKSLDSPLSSFKDQHVMCVLVLCLGIFSYIRDTLKKWGGLPLARTKSFFSLWKVKTCTKGCREKMTYGGISGMCLSECLIFSLIGLLADIPVILFDYYLFSGCCC